MATPETRAKGLGTIDATAMASSVELMGGKMGAAGLYDLGALPEPPIKP